MIYNMGRYNGDFFYINRVHNDGTISLLTRIRAKGLKHSFVERAWNNYTLRVPKDTVTRMGKFRDRYRVQYRNHFFLVIRETETQVTILATNPTVAKRCGIRNCYEGYVKLVNREEITEIEHVKKRICLYLNWKDVFAIKKERNDEFLIKTTIEDYIIPYSGNFALQEENGKFFSIRRDIPDDNFPFSNRKFEISKLEYENWDKYLWDGVKNNFSKWVPKKDVFVYNETDTPIRL